MFNEYKHIKHERALCAVDCASCASKPHLSRHCALCALYCFDYHFIVVRRRWRIVDRLCICCADCDILDTRMYVYAESAIKYEHGRNRSRNSFFGRYLGGSRGWSIELSRSVGSCYLWPMDLLLRSNVHSRRTDCWCGKAKSIRCMRSQGTQGKCEDQTCSEIKGPSVRRHRSKKSCEIENGF